MLICHYWTAGTHFFRENTRESTRADTKEDTGENTQIREHLLSIPSSAGDHFYSSTPHKIKSARDDEHHQDEYVVCGMWYQVRDDEQHQDECNNLFLSEECGLTSRTNCRWRIFTQFLIPTQRSGKTTDATTSQKWVRSLFP